MPNSPFVRQQDPAASLRRYPRKWESHLLQECCPALSAGSLYDLRTCREAAREHWKARAACWHLNHHLVLPLHTQRWPWGSVQWHPEVLLWMVSAAGKEQGSALGFASCRAGWLSANQTRKIHFFFYITHFTCVIVQPSRAEKGHGTKHKVGKNVLWTK